MDGCFNSDPWSILEKNATGRPFWFKVAAIATSEASVSTSKGSLSSTATTAASSIACLRSSNARTAASFKGKPSLTVNGRSRSVWNYVCNYASCAHTALISFSLIAFELHASDLYFVWVIFAFTAVLTPARGLVVSASASVLVGREFDSQPGLTKTL